jgi:hypothetical protein
MLDDITSSYVFVDSDEAEIGVESTTTVRTTVLSERNTLVGEFLGYGPQTLSVPPRPSGAPYLFAIYGQIGSDWHWIDGRWLTLYRGISGTWHGADCDESESNPYRWAITLDQTSDGYATGDIYFHACPGGGAAFYSLTGTQKPGEDWIVLDAAYTGGRGDLGESAPYETSFKVRLNRPPEPNFAP